MGNGEIPAGDGTGLVGPHAAALVDGHWQRYWAVRSTSRAGSRRAARATRRLVTAIEPLAGGAPYPRMMLGLAVLERYQDSGERADLDRGIALVSDVLRNPPADLAQRDVAAARLADAYRERAELDRDMSSIDLSIDAGRRAIGWATGGDLAAWCRVHQNQAMAYGTRWRLAGDRADLDRAIGSWRIHLDVHTDPTVDVWKIVDLGELLRMRGELDREPAEIDEAVALLERASRMAADSRDSWYQLGRAYHAQWTFGRVAGSLALAGRCLAHALDLGTPDDDELLAIHVEWFGVARDEFTGDADGTGAETAGDVDRYRDRIAAACDALARAVTADHQQRALFAIEVAEAELTLDALTHLE